MTILLILAALTFSVWGIKEGMMFVKPVDEPMHNGDFLLAISEPDISKSHIALIKHIQQFDLGPRAHVWFRFYHFIAIAARTLPIVLGVTYTVWVVIGALAFLMDNVFELKMFLVNTNHIGFIDTWLLSLHYTGWSQYVTILPLMLFIGWECMELFYSFGRYGKWIQSGLELVNFGDVKVKIPWYKKVTWTEIEKADQNTPTYEVSFTSTSATVSINSKEEWEVEKHKYIFAWIQIHPFHCRSWVMHSVRGVAIVALTIVNFVR